MEKDAKTKTDSTEKRVVLVGTYKGDQLMKWRGWYNYPISAKDKISEADAAKVNELWLFKDTTAQKNYKAEFVGVKTRKTSGDRPRGTLVKQAFERFSGLLAAPAADFRASKIRQEESAVSGSIKCLFCKGPALLAAVMTTCPPRARVV